MLESTLKILAIFLFLRKIINVSADHQDKNLHVFWGPYVHHHFQNPNVPIKIPGIEIQQKLKFPRSLPLKVEEPNVKPKPSKKKKKSKKLKRERDLKFKQNLDHTLKEMRNKDEGISKDIKSEFEEKNSRMKGHKTKMHYDKASDFERGQKGGYEKYFGDEKKKRKKGQRAENHSRDNLNEDQNVKKNKKGKKNENYEEENSNNDENVEQFKTIEKGQKENLKVEANLNDDKNEDLHIKKSKNKGSKNMAYHNVFMKDEFKRDHTIFGDN